MTTTAEPSTETPVEAATEPTRGEDPKRKFVPTNLAFGWDKGSLVVRSQDVMDRYNVAYLSPSTSKAMDGCPARWAAEKAMPSTEDPFGAAELGTSAHTVMERLFELPGSQRSEDTAMEILLEESKIAWPNRDDKALRGKWIAEVYNAYKGLFQIEDVTRAVVKQTEMRADGVEIVGVPFKGFIDRVDLTPDGIKVIDYKCLALDTVIPTPTGWSTMGALEVGQQVIGVDGRPTDIIGKSQVKHGRDCFQITFSDGASVVCDDEHLWQITDSSRSGETEIVSAVTLARRFSAAPVGAIVLPDTGPLDMPEAGHVRAAAPGVSIASIEAVDSVPTQCIKVAAGDSLFLCGPTMVPTRNSGKVPQNIGRFGDDHGDQIRLYAEVIRVIEGKMPAEGMLYYTRHAKSRVVPINKAKMREVLNKFKKSWVDLNTYVETATFPTKTSALCGWCPLVNSCPSAQADGKTDRKGGAPSKVDLGIPVLRTFDAAELTVGARKQANKRTPAWDLDFGGASDEPGHEDPEALAPPSNLVDPESDLDIPVAEPSAAVLAEPVAEPSLPGDPAGDIDVPFEVPAALIDAVINDPASPANEALKATETGSAQTPSAHLDDSTIQTQTIPTNRENQMSNLLAEGKPWEETVNGSLNPASYAATAVFGTASLAYEEILKAEVKPSKATIDALATTFAHMVNEAQQRLTGVTSYQDAANTRLRGALRTYLDANPLPFGKNKAAWDAWVATGAKHITSIASAAVRLYEADLSGTPWEALAVDDAPAKAEDDFEPVGV